MYSLVVSEPFLLYHERAAAAGSARDKSIDGDALSN